MKLFLSFLMLTTLSAKAMSDVDCSVPPTITACSRTDDGRGPEEPACAADNKAILDAHIEKCGMTTIVAYPDVTKKEICEDFFRVSFPAIEVKSGRVTVALEKVLNRGSRGLCFFAEKNELIRAYDIVTSEMDEDCKVLKVTGTSKTATIEVTHITDSLKMYGQDNPCREKYKDVLKATKDSGGTLTIETLSSGNKITYARKYNDVNLYSSRFFGPKLKAFDIEAKPIVCDDNSGWPFKVGIQAVATEFSERCRKASGDMHHCYPAGTKFPARSQAEHVNPIPVCSVSAPKP